MVFKSCTKRLQNCVIPMKLRGDFIFFGGERDIIADT